MICTFCGTENPMGNRFCGMCGVRLERRKVERRTEQRGSTTCPECGQMNEPKFKFCGMCGAKIDRRTQERRSNGDARANAVANAQLPTPELHRQPARREQPRNRTSTAALLASPAEDEERSLSGMTPRREPLQPVSSVSGPSFLGLNDPEASGDYLLEEAGSSHRGLRALLLLIVVAAIVGLIFVQYRSSLNKSLKSPQPPNANPATIPNSEGKSRPAGKDNGMETAVAAHSLQPAVASLAKVANSGPKAGPGTNQASDEESDPQPDESAQSKPDPAAAAGNDQPSHTLIKARQYLHGEGVRQNCEQGLIYLRAAARENDPQAAVQMGALYSSGLCVAQSRVKAYQWFSTAREMQPDNHWIAKNLNELWAQMSLQERQQIHQ